MPDDPIAFLTGRLSDRPYPTGIGLPGTGEKFTTDGAAETWPGNTFLCHVIRTSDAYQALLELQERVKCSRFGPLITWLPAPSFHMTLFQGMSPGKGGTDDWPQGLDPTASRDAVTAELLARTKDIALPPFAIKADDLFCGFSLTVSGSDARTEHSLRTARMTLRDATGMRPADFDTYRFHITLGYLIAWLSEPTAHDLLAFSDGIFAEFAPRLQNIPLDPCAFCDFETMHHFEPLRTLA